MPTANQAKSIVTESQEQYTEWKFFGTYRVELVSDWEIGESVPADHLQCGFSRQYMRPVPKGITHFVVEIDLSGRRYDGPFMRDFSVPMRGLIQGRAATADIYKLMIPINQTDFLIYTLI